MAKFSPRPFFCCVLLLSLPARVAFSQALPTAGLPAGVPSAPAVAVGLPTAVTPGQADALVIPPGQEALLERLFAVPGQPPPERIQVERAWVIAVWQDGHAVRLRHPSAPSAPRELGRTQQFAVTAHAGEWPSARAQALLGQLRSQEATFRWQAAAQAAQPKVSSTATAGQDKQLERLLEAAERASRLDEGAKAQAFLLQAAKLPATRPLLRARLGAALLQLGRRDPGQALWSAALAELRAAALAPGAPAAARVDHAAATALQAPAAAVAQVREALTQPSTVACEWVEVGRSLELAGHREAAAEVAQVIRERDAKCKRAWLLAGGLVAHAPGSAAWQSALALAEQGLRQIPDDADLLFLQGSALHAGWRNAEAAAAWEQVAAKNIHHPNVLGMLATAYTQGPEVQEDAFLARFQARAAADPNDIVARYILGTIHYYRDDFAQVLAFLEPLRTVVPEEPRVHLYTAMALFHLGRVREADEHLAALERLGHDDPDYYYCRSVMWRERDFEQSRRDLEKFVQLSQKRQNSDPKVAKITRELEIMRDGRVPNRFLMWPAPVRWGLGAAAVLLLLAIGWRIARAGRKAVPGPRT